MARVALKDWKEQIRDPKIECMSRDEMTALQKRSSGKTGEKCIRKCRILS